MAGQRQRAAGHGQPADARAARGEERAQPGLDALQPAARLAPFRGLGHGAADPQGDQRRRQPDQEDRAHGEIGEQVARHRRRDHPEVDRALQHRGEQRPPGARPGLAQQRGADRPLPADAERGEEAEERELLPLVAT